MLWHCAQMEGSSSLLQSDGGIYLVSAAPHCKGVDASWPSPARTSNKGLLHCGGRGERPATRLSTRLNIIGVRAMLRRAAQHEISRYLPREFLDTSQTGLSASPSHCDSLQSKHGGPQ